MKVKNNKNKVNFCDIILYKRYYFNKEKARNCLCKSYVNLKYVYDKCIYGIYFPDENNDDELKY